MDDYEWEDFDWSEDPVFGDELSGVADNSEEVINREGSCAPNEPNDLAEVNEGDVVSEEGASSQQDDDLWEGFPSDCDYNQPEASECDCAEEDGSPEDIESSCAPEAEVEALNESSLLDRFKEQERNELTARLLCEWFGVPFPGFNKKRDSILRPGKGIECEFIRRPGDGKILYVEDGQDEPMILARVYAAKMSGDCSRLGRYQQLAWSVRMFRAINHPLLPGLPVVHRPILPSGSPDGIDRKILEEQLEAIMLLEACRDYYSDGVPYPFTIKFGARWTGMAQDVVYACKKWFIDNHVLLRSKKKHGYLELYRLNNSKNSSEPNTDIKKAPEEPWG